MWPQNPSCLHPPWAPKFASLPVSVRTKPPLVTKSQGDGTPVVGLAIVIGQVMKPSPPPASVTSHTTLNVPDVVGVPVIIPVTVSRTRPGGIGLAEKVRGPLLTELELYGTPTWP